MQREKNKVRVEGCQGWKTYKWWIKMETTEGQEDDYWVTTHALLCGDIVMLFFNHPGDSQSVDCHYELASNWPHLQSPFIPPVGKLMFFWVFPNFSFLVINNSSNEKVKCGKGGVLRKKYPDFRRHVSNEMNLYSSYSSRWCIMHGWITLLKNVLEMLQELESVTWWETWPHGLYVINNIF